MKKIMFLVGILAIPTLLYSAWTEEGGTAGATSMQFYTVKIGTYTGINGGSIWVSSSMVVAPGIKIDGYDLSVEIAGLKVSTPASSTLIELLRANTSYLLATTNLLKTNTGYLLVLVNQLQSDLSTEVSDRKIDTAEIRQTTPTFVTYSVLTDTAGALTNEINNNQTAHNTIGFSTQTETTNRIADTLEIRSSTKNYVTYTQVNSTYNALVTLINVSTSQFNPSNIAPGTLDADVIVSSVGVNAVGVAQIHPGGTTPDNTKYLSGDGTWSVPLGAGDAVLSATQTFSGTNNLNNPANTYQGGQIIKAWVSFDGYTGGTCTIKASYNVSNVAREGTGQYTITWTTPFATTNYAVTITAGYADQGVFGSLLYNAEPYATGGVKIDVINAGNSLTDARSITVMAIGTQ